MRYAFLLLLIAGLCMAFSVRPAYIETKDTGNQNLPTLDVGITIDCGDKSVEVEVRSNQSGEAVKDAKTYMFYTDYEYQALPNPGTTDAGGKATMAVPGNLKFLTALFILRVDHTQFRSREIEYTYKKCFEPQPSPPPPPPPPKNNTAAGTNQTKPPQNQSPPANTTTPAPPPEAASNDTKPNVPPKEDTAKPQTLCPLGLIMLGLIFARARA
ncbi:MAG: hypothetical protein U0R44_03925 [Candidatus Micrarchaeia archaeon]